jgi:hypothetical protein
MTKSSAQSSTFLGKYRIWIALLVVALISWWVSGFDDDTSSSSQSGKSTNAGSKSISSKSIAAKSADKQRDAAEALALISRGFAPRVAMSKLASDPFTVVSFEPPPPPPPPPPKPVAPPLSFKYLGALGDTDVDAGNTSTAGAAAPKERAVFLDSGGQLLIARKGDTIAGQYRVIEITDTSMQFEYLPLAERQTLNFGR